MTQGTPSHLTENQHFVPQVYLRGFTRADKPDQVYAYDLIKKVSFSTNVANVAHRRFFHDFAPQFIKQGDDPQAVEHFLANEVEGPFATAIRFIEDTVEQQGITWDHRILLAFYTTFQVIRTAEFRTRFEVLFAAGSQPLQDYAEKQDYPGEIPDLSAIDTFTPEQSSLWHAAIIGNPPAVLEMAKPLLDHVIYLGVNDTPMPFWTSDNPVVATSNDPSASVWGGFAMSGAEILYPLTRRLIVVMHERTFLQREHPEKVARDGQCISMDVEDVKYCNAQQAAQCSRQIYSPTGDFSLLDEIESKNPGALSRSKIGVSDLLSG